MTISDGLTGALSGSGRNIRVCAGTALVAAVISSWAMATAQADAPSDATIGAVGSLGEITIPDVSELLNIDVAVSPITAAIDAAEAPINTAQSLIDAVPTASLGADDLAVLMNQDMFNTQLLDTLGALGTFQEGLTYADPAYLAQLDEVVLATLDNNVLDATQAFLGTLSDPGLDFSAGLDLVTADLGSALGTASVFGATLWAELAGFVGLMP